MSNRKTPNSRGSKIKLKDIQLMFENGLLSEKGKDCFIFLLKTHDKFEDEINNHELMSEVFKYTKEKR